MAQKPTFYIRLDYRAVYIGYRYPNDDGHEINYSPSGYEFMQSTIDLICKRYNILVSWWAVEWLFIEIIDGQVISNCIEIKGRNLTTGLPSSVCVSLQINECLNTLITATASIVALNLKHTFPNEIYTALLESEFVLHC